MGTAVLSPQDCFVSPHGPHDHRFQLLMRPSSNTPRSGRNAAAMQAGIASIASDCARWKATGAANSVAGMGVLNRLSDSPGLLPVPVGRFDTRHSSLTRSSCTPLSSIRHISSTVSSRSRQSATAPALNLPSPRTSSSTSRTSSSTVPTSSSNSKSSTSRSASAGLLASRGSRASAMRECVHERLIPSTDRIPLKVVQNNGMDDREFGTAAMLVHRGDLLSSKFLDAKRGLQEKRMVGSAPVGDLRKRTHSDFICHQQGSLERDGLTLSMEGSGGGTKGLRRDSIGKNLGKRRETDRCVSGTEAREKEDGGTQVVTILQRPKDKEAAIELISRFFKKVEAASLVNKDFDLESQKKKGRADNPICSKVDGSSVSKEYTEMKVLKKTLRSENASGISAIENVPLVPERLAVCENHFHLTTKDRVPFNEMDCLRQGSTYSQTFACQHHTEVMEAPLCENDMEEDVDFGEISKHIASMAAKDKWLERWAGPAYTNSPPPSSLPLPKFPTKQLRTPHLQHSCIGDQSVADSCHHPSAGTPLVSVLPSRRSVSFNGRMPVYEQECACDVASATKDLRRMLNLDAC